MGFFYGWKDNLTKQLSKGINSLEQIPLVEIFQIINPSLCHHLILLAK